MKRFIILLMLWIAAGSSCNKTTPERVVNPPLPPVIGPPSTIKVLDKYTGKPISGATVVLQKCATGNNYGHCARFLEVSRGITNDTGAVTFSYSPKAEYIFVENQTYWSTRVGLGERQVALVAVCTIKLAIKKTSSYSATDFLTTVVRNPDCFSILCWSATQKIGLPMDTVIYLKAQGDNKNEVLWYINYANSGTWNPLPSLFIKRFDTAMVSMTY